MLRKISAAGAAILMHVRHEKLAKRNVVLSERVLYLAVHIGKKKFESLQHMHHTQVIQNRILAIFSDSCRMHYMVRNKMVLA